MAKEHDKEENVEMVPDEEAGPPRPSEDEAGAEDAAAKLKKAREELRKCAAEKKEYLDGWQRARADLSNYKKDEAKRFEEFGRFAAEGVIAEAVAVLDSFDLALQHEMPKDVEKGLVMIRSQIEDILRRRGLEVMQPLGQKFDPAYHESLGEVETDGEEGVVVEVLQLGYLLAGRVLRPARVKISNKEKEMEKEK